MARFLCLGGFLDAAASSSVDLTLGVVRFVVVVVAVVV